MMSLLLSGPETTYRQHLNVSTTRDICEEEELHHLQSALTGNWYANRNIYSQGYSKKITRLLKKHNISKKIEAAFSRATPRIILFRILVISIRALEHHGPVHTSHKNIYKGT